jgi:hypothetical protein
MNCMMENQLIQLPMGNSTVFEIKRSKHLFWIQKELKNTFFSLLDVKSLFRS